jgi:hypothetical protein
MFWLPTWGSAKVKLLKASKPAPRLRFQPFSLFMLRQNIVPTVNKRKRHMEKHEV